MAEIEKRPWRFTIEFDEEKAKRNGYNVDDLYDCVGKYAEQMGNVRIGLGTWQAKNRKVQFGAQCPVCATLSSYFVAPQEEHLYPVVTVSSQAALT